MKKFLIIGHQNAITYKEIFPLIKDDKIWIGYKFNGKPMEFIVPDDYELKGNVNGYLPDGRKYIGVGGTCWFTNLDIPKRHEDLILVEKYSPEKYPKYDNYDAINVDKTADIPEDYVPCWFACPLAADCKYAQQKGMDAAAEGCCEKCNGQMEIPITFIDKYNPEQFDIVKFRKGNDGKDLTYHTCKKKIQFLRTSASLSAGRKCNGIMGVPITFLDKYNPEQFEIIGATESEGKGFSCGLWNESSGIAQPVVAGERKYKRIFISSKTQRNNGCPDYISR